MRASMNISTFETMKAEPKDTESQTTSQEKVIFGLSISKRFISGGKEKVLILG